MIHITAENGKPRLVAVDKKGKEVFNGTIATEAELKAVPEAIRKRLESLHARMGSGGFGSGGGFRSAVASDRGEVSAVVESAGGIRLFVTDGRSQRLAAAEVYARAESRKAVVGGVPSYGAGLPTDRKKRPAWKTRPIVWWLG